MPSFGRGPQLEEVTVTSPGRSTVGEGCLLSGSTTAVVTSVGGIRCGSTAVGAFILVGACVQPFCSTFGRKVTFVIGRDLNVSCMEVCSDKIVVPMLRGSSATTVVDGSLSGIDGSECASGSFASLSLEDPSVQMAALADVEGKDGETRGVFEPQESEIG